MVGSPLLGTVASIGPLKWPFQLLAPKLINTYSLSFLGLFDPQALMASSPSPALHSPFNWVFVYLPVSTEVLAPGAGLCLSCFCCALP